MQNRTFWLRPGVLLRRGTPRLFTLNSVAAVLLIAAVLPSQALPWGQPPSADAWEIFPDPCTGRSAAAKGPEITTPQGSPPPLTGARAAVVMDALTGTVILDKNGNERRAPASTTKIMTAILAYSLVPPEAENNVVISRTDGAAMEGSSIMGLWPDANVSLRDLMYGLMLPSGNDAAVELARNLAPSEADFVHSMNALARRLGLRDTHFANPHGLDDPAHYSSARDLATLTRYAMQNERFRSLVAAPSYHLAVPFDYDIKNGNSLLRSYEGSNGVKIGYTEDAGWTFVASAEREGREYIVSLLNTLDRDADAAALLDWAFAQPLRGPIESETPRVLIGPQCRHRP